MTPSPEHQVRQFGRRRRETRITAQLGQSNQAFSHEMRNIIANQPPVSATVWSKDTVKAPAMVPAKITAAAAVPAPAMAPAAAAVPAKHWVSTG